MLLALVGEGAPLRQGHLFQMAKRLMLGKPDIELLGSFRQHLEDARATLASPEVRPHEVTDALAPLSGEEVLLLMALSDETVRTWVRRDLTELRPLSLQIRGGDLVEEGFEPGIPIGEALRATRAARLDGELDASQELEFALRWLRKRDEEEG